MEILFDSLRVEKLLAEEKQLKRKHPDVSTEVVRRRLEQLRLVDNLLELRYLPSLKFHKLHTGEDIFVISVSDKKRLIFKPNPDALSQPVRQVPLNEIQSIIIIDIGDYH